MKNDSEATATDLSCRTGRLQRSVVVFLALTALASCGGGSNAKQSFLAPQQQTQIPPQILVSLTKLSTDTFTNSTSQHATEVEPAAFAFGQTVVTAFQVGRIFDGGAADLGFATSSDGGASWAHGLLPGITMFQGGTATAASDAAVAFDAAHRVWMISSLAIMTTGQVTAEQVMVSRSQDGLTWENPVLVSTTPHADKNWIACDNIPTSPHFGNCYVEWDDPSANDLIWMSTSNDGGFTWQPALNTADRATGLGGIPVVQPNGKVIVPILGVAAPQMLAFSSDDGGSSWSATTAISTVTDHTEAGSLRSDALPTVAMDAGGSVYVVWQDCRFRALCASNDLVLSTSTDGLTWTLPVRIPIDPVTSTVDHFIPGLGADPNTTGTATHLGITYYFYPTSDCTASTCVLNVGFISSPDAGATWSVPTTLVTGMALNWLPNTFSGRMVADYISTFYSGGKAFAVFALAQPNVGTQFDEAIYATSNGFTTSLAAHNATSLIEQPVAGAKSDHSPRSFYDLEHRYPKPPQD